MNNCGDYSLKVGVIATNTNYYHAYIHKKDVLCTG